MRFLMRLAALGALGYAGYLLYERYGDFIQQMVIGDEAAHDEMAQQQISPGHPGQNQGVLEETVDNTGEVRTHRVGRGVIHT